MRLCGNVRHKCFEILIEDEGLKRKAGWNLWLTRESQNCVFGFTLASLSKDFGNTGGFLTADLVLLRCLLFPI